VADIANIEEPMAAVVTSAYESYEGKTPEVRIVC
jgi:hypothetical protein